MNTPFKSYSQAAQDRFVHELLVKPENLLNGTFVDIGCCHPTQLSNTYALEQLGWRGVLVDNDPGAVELCGRVRKNVVWHADATKIDWEAKLANVRPAIGPVIDYLSLDVDAATLASLDNLLRYDLRFRVITIEHDAYRFGGAPRAAMRALLEGTGYQLICADVCSADGLPFEDWWVCADLAARAARFTCAGKKWTEMFPPNA